MVTLFFFNLFFSAFFCVSGLETGFIKMAINKQCPVPKNRYFWQLILSALIRYVDYIYTPCPPITLNTGLSLNVIAIKMLNLLPTGAVKNPGITACRFRVAVT